MGTETVSGSALARKYTVKNGSKPEMDMAKRTNIRPS